VAQYESRKAKIVSEFKNLRRQAGEIARKGSKTKF